MIGLILLSAGQSQRFGDNKQTKTLPNGKMVWEEALAPFLSFPEIEQIVHVVSENFPKPKHPPKHYTQTAGGVTRQASVLKGLSCLSKEIKFVLIHDAARPWISLSVIYNVIKALKFGAGVVPVIEAVDTLKQCEAGKVLKTVSRENLFHTQTPQGFCLETLFMCHTRAQNAATDDAQLLEAQGFPVLCVPGERKNKKITFPDDWEKNLTTRVATGVDVHAFVSHPTQKYILLCGIKIPSEKILAATSDGDVVFHALTDALLGVIGEGDIGTHFPNAEGENSEKFVHFALERLYKKGGKIQHIHGVIIGEKPKMAPYRAEMVEKLSSILLRYETSPQSISLQATTTDKCGFLGRAEGLASMVTVTTQFLSS